MVAVGSSPRQFKVQNRVCGDVGEFQMAAGKQKLRISVLIQGVRAVRENLLVLVRRRA